MYCQILVSEKDTKFQQIFWRKELSDPFLVYILKTVTYVTSFALFLALRTIQQFCKDEKTNFPVAGCIVQSHICVDDFYMLQTL